MGNSTGSALAEQASRRSSGLTENSLAVHNREQIDKAIDDLRFWAEKVIDQGGPFTGLELRLALVNGKSLKLSKPRIRLDVKT